MTIDIEAPTSAVGGEEALVLEQVERLLAENDPATASVEQFLGAQFDLGLGWVHFPKGEGGLGVIPNLQKVVNERIAAAGGPNPYGRNPIGYGMCGPTIVVHGTPEQKALLRPLFTGEEVWCQLFSEPGAGSDVASLAARAVRDGDEWILNGQKVWTTVAHFSTWGLIIARTDTELPKHKGITAFLVNMHSPGVEVKPLVQITGEAEFNEVFFTDVRIPDAMRLGDVGEGWRVSLTTLMNERVSIGGAIIPKGSGPISQALDAYRRRPDRSAAERDQLVRLWVAAEVNRLTNLRASKNRASGTPGPEGSVSKLAMAELNKLIYSFAVDLLGAHGMLYEGGYGSADAARHGMFTDNVQKNFLRSRANSIEGGTSEVMRNILAERVLGLPGEPRVDKDLPWSQVPRS